MRRIVRALLRSVRSDDDLAKALAKVGLYVERLDVDDDVQARLLQGSDVVVVDPRLLDGSAPAKHPAEREAGREESERTESLSLEELCYRRLETVLDKLQGGTLPNLHGTVMLQIERALFRLALERTSGITAAAAMLGIHRNTFARRMQVLGLSRTDAEAPTRAAAGVEAPSYD